MSLRVLVIKLEMRQYTLYEHKYGFTRSSYCITLKVSLYFFDDIRGRWNLRIPASHNAPFLVDTQLLNSSPSVNHKPVMSCLIWMYFDWSLWGSTEVIKSSIFSRLRPGGTSLSALQAEESLLYLLNVTIDMFIEASKHVLLQYESTRTHIKCPLESLMCGTCPSSPLQILLDTALCAESYSLKIVDLWLEGISSC